MVELYYPCEADLGYIEVARNPASRRDAQQRLCIFSKLPIVWVWKCNNKKKKCIEIAYLFIKIGANGYSISCCFS